MTDALDLLTDADLSALASGLRSGRLHAPIAAVAVQRFCSSEHAAAVADRLQRLHEEGMRPEHLALLAETLVRTRKRQAQQADLVDLVWTGPETPATTNLDTGVVVRDLFGSAETEVVVAGFAVYQGQAVFKRLAERMEERPGLRVRLFLNVQRQPGDASRSEEVLRRFAQRFCAQEWPGERLPELHYDPRSLELDAVKRTSLHAKCVVVDRRTALVTSANFTEAAQTRNIEVGALIRCERFAKQLAEHFEQLAEARILQPVSLPVCSPGKADAAVE
jgi:phosphatidylserine/phosphatidylglycerophosphate/cardiolipin synthase-like enzyme